MTGGAYDFWLLDLDGTLVDVSDAYVREVIDEVGDRLGHGFSPAEARRCWYGTEAGRDEVLAEIGIDPDRFWSIFHEVERPGARAEATFLYDDAAAVVPDLAGPVGVLTHCQPYLTDAVLDHLDIRDWFDTVVCCSDETGWKPDPRPVELTMRELGVGPDGQRGVLAGDNVQDVDAALNAGLDAVHVTRDADRPAARESAGLRRVDRLTDLAA